MEEHTIIQKLIEREERYMNDAAERQDAEDAQFYKIRKQAFEEVEPFFRQLLDENQALRDQRNGYYENAKYTEAAFHGVTKLRTEIARLLDENEQLKVENQLISQLAEKDIKDWKEHYEAKTKQIQADKAAVIDSANKLLKRLVQLGGEYETGPHEIRVDDIIDEYSELKKVIARTFLQRLESGDKEA